jgi:hypothetical protein
MSSMSVLRRVVGKRNDKVDRGVRAVQLAVDVMFCITRRNQLRKKGGKVSEPRADRKNER